MGEKGCRKMRVSDQSGFLSKPDSESWCGIVTLCGWEGEQGGILERLWRKLHHLGLSFLHLMLMKGHVWQHLQDSRGRLSDSTPNLLSVLVEWSNNTSETNYLSLLVFTTCKAHSAAAKDVRARSVSLGALLNPCPVHPNLLLLP